MLITFDPSKLRFEKVKIMSATTALGGSVRILNETATKKSGKEMFTRLDAPMSVVRTFLIQNHHPKFIQPAEGAITFYDDKILTIELAPSYLKNERVTEGVFGEREWLPQAELNWRSVIRPDMEDGKWYFDGMYAYTFNSEPMSRVVADSIPLSANNSFREVQAFALNLTRLAAGSATLSRKGKKKTIEEQFALEERSCIAYVVGSEYVISPPIWKTLGSDKWSSTRNKSINDREDGVFDTSAAFDSVDDKFFVTLSFAMYAASEIARAYGYDSVSPLQLPKLMVQLKTVNLPRVDKEVKNTFDVGLTFSQGMAWLLGLLYRAQTDDQVFAVRRAMKYLSTKGIYLKAKLKQTNLTQNEHLTENGQIPIVSRKEALVNVNNMTAAQWDLISRSVAYKGVMTDVLSFE